MTETPAALAPGTALVLVDLQHWIVNRPSAPLTGAAVVRSAARLKDAFESAGLPVVLVRYARTDGSDGGPDSAFNRFAPDVAARPGNEVVTKYGIDAFDGTDLADRLRRLGATALVVAGITTEYGVGESVRTAVTLGYPTTVVEDAVTALAAPAHTAALQAFRDLGVTVTDTDALLAATTPA
ncbi:cysteine hydrolase family protein [Streptomyces sp. NRRL S-350]|uniref:cysteine hydrolase family protein n=1 Tax=Streptomyces sp. NRRL S-350 TaxID=1463902 RepID=UPI0004C25669|nr:isochorismatase family protein [Streptomyces sp. NRRL S-350]